MTARDITSELEVAIHTAPRFDLTRDDKTRDIKAAAFPFGCGRIWVNLHDGASGLTVTGAQRAGFVKFNTARLITAARDRISGTSIVTPDGRPAYA